MRLSALSERRVTAYLDRLGIVEVQHTVEGLAALQSAHLMAVPFHNLWLLANDGRPCDLTPIEALVDHNAQGAGGTCNRTTPPFTALLQALGFDAVLAAATVREPGDHFVCIVRIGKERILCDVGNGHPYLQPWRMDGPAQSQDFHGWRFAFEPTRKALTRTFRDGTVKTVYTVDPTPRFYSDFAPVVRAHYTQAGFGPFLSALRAVRIEPDAMSTLRDRVYARDTRFGHSARHIVGRETITGLLTERFRLPKALVEEALTALAPRRLDLFDEPRWLSLGSGTIADSAGVEAPPRNEVPDVLITLATIGRGDAARRLLGTLATEVRDSGYPGRVGVLMVENHAPETSIDLPDCPELVVQRVPIADLRPALARAAEVGVLPSMTERTPVPIGAARVCQVAAVRTHLREPVPGLPHPDTHPMVVWMLDDDLAFQQLGPDGAIRRRTHLLFRAARLWATLPASVVIGTFTGDPPVPGLDCLGGQLRDLRASVMRMLELGPDAAWEPPPTPPLVYDAYYDLTEAPGTEQIWPYAPHAAGASVQDVAVVLLADLPRLLDGQQLTRSLTWEGEEAPPRPSLRRGGNTLFLDLDALFRWPTPVLGSADGVMTRRADTMWAALAQSEAPGAVVETTLPLLHGRDGQRPEAKAPNPATEAAKVAAQVRGTALARALSDGRSLAEELPRREGRVSAHRKMLTERIAELHTALADLTAWQHPAIDAALPSGLAVLDALAARAEASVPTPGDVDELEAFLAALPDASQRWRGAL